MPSVVICPSPILQFFLNSGQPAAGGSVLTQVSGVNAPTYSDSAGTILLPNPIPLNSRGEVSTAAGASAQLFLLANTVYTFTLFDNLGNQIWVATYVNGVQVILTPANVGAALYPQVAPSENGLTIVNFQYPPYIPDRYATNTTPGTTDMFAAIQTANNAAAIAGAAVSFLPGEVYGVNVTANGAPLNMTASWVCNGPQAILRRIDVGTGTTNYFVTALQVSHLTMRGLIFDGQVTVAASTTPNLDIGAIGSFHDDNTELKWSQAFGVIFRQTQFCTVEDCVFMNFLRAGLRHDASTGTGPPVASSLGAPWTFFAGGGQAQTGTLTNMLSLGNRTVNCRVQRTRGWFGDSFYTENSENNVYVNCHAYDYERIGFVLELGNQTNNYGTNGAQYVNCTADFGHDAVTSGNQSNVGFWSESCDGLSMTNCESKNTSVGWLVGSAVNTSQGTFRPYTGDFTFTGCRAIRCASAGFKVSLGTRDAHVVFQGCFAEINSTAATYSSSVGLGANGFQIVASPGGSPPDGTGGVSYHIEIRDCHVDLVAMSATAGGNPSFNAAAVNMWQGGVTNAQQLQVDITGLSTKWLTSAGALDTAAQTTYELTTGNNFGYFGDVIFTGANNGGAQFKGKARIRDCTNQTGGTFMISSEINSQNSVLEIINTMCSLRTGGATSNNGILNLSNCMAVDYRGNLGFAQVFATNCFFSDMDSGNVDRTSWGNATLGACEFYFNQCRFQRPMLIILGSGLSSTSVSQSLTLTGCEFVMQFLWSGGGAVPLTLAQGGGTWANVHMNGCIFRNSPGGHSSATGSMIVMNSNGTLTVDGAGNVYDANYVTTGGHVIQYNSTPTFNDAPQTAAAPFTTVNGVKQQFVNA